MSIKILPVLLLLSLSLFGQEKKPYIIRGTVSDPINEDVTVYLEQMGLAITEGWPRIDSVKIKNGKFVFKGKIDHPDLYRLGIKGTNPKGTILIIEPGTIKVNFSRTNIDVSGGPIQEDFVKYVESSDHFGDNVVYFINKYIEQPVIRTFVFRFLKIPNLQHECMDTIYPKLSQEIKEKLEREKLEWDKRLKKVQEKQKLEEEKNTPEAVRTGKPYTDFKAESSDGSTLRLSEIRKGKRLVLLDFWASWCNPCMKEMPNIIQIYKDYKDKGLEIVGISQDRNKEAWTKTIEKNQMKWIQLTDTEEPANENVSELYHVKAIPYTILIDSTGTIVARNLRGEELRETVEKLLK